MLQLDSTHMYYTSWLKKNTHTQKKLIFTPSSHRLFLTFHESVNGHSPHVSFVTSSFHLLFNFWMILPARKSSRKCFSFQNLSSKHPLNKLLTALGVTPQSEQFVEHARARARGCSAGVRDSSTRPPSARRTRAASQTTFCHTVGVQAAENWLVLRTLSSRSICDFYEA